MTNLQNTYDAVESPLYEQGMVMAELYLSFRQGNSCHCFSLNSFSSMLLNENAECRAGFFDTVDAYIAEYMAIHNSTSNQV